MGLVAILLVPLVLATDEPASASSGHKASLSRTARNGTFALCLTVLGVPFVAGGALSVLVPLEMSHLGGSGLEVGATFFSPLLWRR